MRSLKKLWRNNRGIEGLPIRLVIALVVGVASLAIMTSILGGLPTFDSTEVSVSYDNSTVRNAADNSKTITINVTDDKGEPVQNARIVISSGTASMQGGSYVAKTGTDSNSVDVKITDESNSGTSADVKTNLRADQETGTLKVEVKPPSDGNYVDEQENDKILVTR